MKAMSASLRSRNSLTVITRAPAASSRFLVLSFMLVPLFAQCGSCAAVACKPRSRAFALRAANRVARALASHRKSTDCYVVPVRIPERELPGSRVRVHVRLLFEPSDVSACPLERHVEIVHAEEKEEPVARPRLVRILQGGMLMSAPLGEAEQAGFIRIQHLPKVARVRRVH